MAEATFYHVKTIGGMNKAKFLNLNNNTTGIMLLMYDTLKRLELSMNHLNGIEIDSYAIAYRKVKAV